MQITRYISPRPSHLVHIDGAMHVPDGATHGAVADSIVAPLQLPSSNLNLG